MRQFLFASVCGALFILLFGCATPEQRRLEAALHDAVPATLRPAGSIEAVERQIEAAKELRVAIAANAERRRCERIGGKFRDGKCEGAADEFDRVMVTGSRFLSAEIITNNQEQGVDEGDFVKKVGQYIIVLRQGYLHSIDIGDEASQRLAVTDVIEVVENAAEQDIWFDEILTFDSGVLLLGYNFGEEYAELMLFTVDAGGKFKRSHRFQVSSEDYYSTTNYGARRRGDELVLSLTKNLVNESEHLGWPKWRKVKEGNQEWRPLMDPSRLHLPLVIEPYPVAHTLLRCKFEDLLAGALDCATAGVLANFDSQLYVTTENAYLAVEGWMPEVFEDMVCFLRRCEPTAGHGSYRYTALYRISRDGSVSVARIQGTAMDQFSFSETNDGFYILTHHYDRDATPVMLLQHVAPTVFGDSLNVEAAVVARIPDVDILHRIRLTKTAAWIGEVPHAISSQGTQLLVQPFDGSKVRERTVLQTGERIEPLEDQVLIFGDGVDGQWTVTAVSADSRFSPGPAFPISGYHPADHRSHAFNAAYRDDGLLFGLPGTPASDATNSRWADKIVSDILFFSAEELRIDSAGVLDMQKFSPDPPCENSWTCYEWYGNARLFFVGDRIFALSSSGLKEAVRTRHGIRGIRSVRLD